ncbi:MAG: FtsQ-type POTRA domain-containing protein [Proteobacteria bacterium]|nr:FtsQ-type POTRA domain-containing protein [Pseudomonadota bacterium]
MKTIEPKLAERRRNVSEDRARRRLKWILFTIVALSVGVVGFWLVRSPLLSISTVTYTNVVNADPESALTQLGVGIGSPTIDVDGGAIAAAVESDPWVDEAVVSVKWPGTIEIDVTEHVLAAPAKAGDGWVLLSAATTVIGPAATPTGDDLVINIDQGSIEPGIPIDDALTVGAVAFARALREDLAVGASIYVEGDGLFATVAGHTVRLGRPVDLSEKAMVLAALIDQGLDPEATIDVIAPTRPAVLNPQPEVEAEE